MAGRGGRNDDVIAEALGMIAGVLGRNPNREEIGANRQLGEFQRNNPLLDELEVAGVTITCDVFRREFLRRYFPEDVRGRKEIEFLELKQGNMTVPEYESKFVELEKYQRIHRFAALVDGSRIFEEDNVKMKSSHSRELVDKKGKKPMDRGLVWGDSSAPVRCYRCGEAVHHIHECKSEENKCYRCGKAGYVVADCKGKAVTCYNCGEEGHITPKCTKPRKNQAGGKVFAFSGLETTPED
ncbi:uncharacterized protein LOC131658280 [Vicia villosa]|uniref:uncharacterized protein LOC131658280 n=1 Tax=Vicia villosa TaxID=3911 RepID=UPI00273BDC19|nr:uncharacterized protein LOC131658280 [Vicia villosa]